MYVGTVGPIASPIAIVVARQGTFPDQLTFEVGEESLPEFLNEYQFTSRQMYRRTKLILLTQVMARSPFLYLEAIWGSGA